MKKFAVRSDMEGLSGVICWEEVIPGASLYEKARKTLHQELDALCLGLADGGAEYVEIYDEHYYGRNVESDLLPAGTAVIRGKPPYTAAWPGGLDSGFSGLILQGYHAMAGVETGVLSHTYEPDIRAIWINGTLVGEIGVEAAVAGECGVPLVLLIGDAHGAAEAEALVPGVESVVVKTGHGLQRGLCRSWPDVHREILAKAAAIARGSSSAKPLVFAPPVEMIVQLNLGPYRTRVSELFPDTLRDDRMTLRGDSVTAVWARYWDLKDQALASLPSA